MLKRSFDLSLSVFSLLGLSPVLLAVAVLIKIGSPGPIFYRGVRTGLNGIPFRIFKFRTMVPDAERVGGPSTALNDPRLTKLGRFLRSHKLDELPQLFNVIAGDMSIVGPRPQVERYTSLYKGEEKLILTVRPGLTDLASVHFIDMDAILGDGDVDEKYMREIEPYKNVLRVKYVKEQSFIGDLKIIGLTVLRLFGISGSGISKT